MSTQLRFRDLAIGDTFDFVGPDRALVTFWRRCRKTGERTYTDEDGLDYRVGSIGAKVYHVERAAVKAS